MTLITTEEQLAAEKQCKLSIKMSLFLIVGSMFFLLVSIINLYEAYKVSAIDNDSKIAVAMFSIITIASILFFFYYLYKGRKLKSQ